MDAGISCYTVCWFYNTTNYLYEKEIPGTGYQLAPGIKYIDIISLPGNAIQQDL